MTATDASRASGGPAEGPAGRGGARRFASDTEARMSLREHLRELRRRVFIAALAVLVASVGGWFLYPAVFHYLTQPLIDLNGHGHDVRINFPDVGGAFDLRLKMSLAIGIVISSPVWLYELWAFITPGLTRKERGYTYGFLGAAVPLFLAGVYLSTIFVPNALTFFLGLTPHGGVNLIPAETYFGFFMRTALAFGVSFLLPVLLVALNFVGILPGRTLLRTWRWVVVLVFVFAAIATPTPDIWSMFELALPLLALMAAAIGVCLLNDRRRARREPEWGSSVGDDEASAL